MMKENNDSEVFDLSKSEIVKEESFFENGILIRQINNQDCGSPFSRDYLDEENDRLKLEFENLLNNL